MGDRAGDAVGGRSVATVGDGSGDTTTTDRTGPRATTLIDLHALGPDVRIEGHLPECSRPDLRVADCDWCHWAVTGAGIRDVVDHVLDMRSLVDDHDGRTADVSVAWAVAAGDTVDRRFGSRVAAPEVLVPSVRELVARLHRMAVDESEPLRRRVDVAVAAGGPIERRCLIGAGSIAVAALQRPSEHHRWHRLSDRAAGTLARATELLSVDTQAEHLASAVDGLHWDGLVELRTQPEWRRRPPPTGSAGGSPTTSSGPGMGSLESLVVESVMDLLSDDLADVARELARTAPRVKWHRSPSRGRLSAATRRLTWKRARVDWHLTFLDSERTRCWEGDDGTAFVPWTVGLAVEEGARLGLVSATHAME